MAILKCLDPPFDTEGPQALDVILCKSLNDLLNLLDKLDSVKVTCMEILLGGDGMSLEVLLNEAKQLFDWVEPGRVLSVEQHIHFHLAASLQDHRVFVDDCVVHHQDYVPMVVPRIASNAPQGMVYKVLKQCSIDSAFNDLCRNHLVLTYGRYQ